MLSKFIFKSTLKNKYIFNPLSKRLFCSSKLSKYTPDSEHNESLTLLEHIIRIVGGIPFLPFGFYTVDKNNKKIIEYFGKYYTTKNEGLNYNLPIARTEHNVYMGLRSAILEKSKVVDKVGNPIIISAVLNYCVIDPVKYTYNVKDSKTFVENQASIVIKEITSKYSYDELKKETSEITLKAILGIQKLVEVSGVKIEKLSINDFSYAPEIAEKMLVQQQALAHIQAKKTIVESAVVITKDVLNNFENLSIDAKNKIAINLLTVLTSGSGSQNVLPLN